MFSCIIAENPGIEQSRPPWYNGKNRKGDSGMERRIFCFGDSNTYGYDPREPLGGRYPADARWPELLRRVAALPACPPPSMTAVQQTCLAQAIVWRHGMDALDDRDVVFPVQYAAATLRLLACLAAVSDCTDAQLVVLVTREVENDPEALTRLHAGLQIEPPKMNAQEARDDEKMQLQN